MAKQSQKAGDPAQKPKWDNSRDVMNGLVSIIAVPVLSRLAKLGADNTDPNSWLRNPMIIRTIDGLAGFLENKTDRIGNPIVGTMAEKVINAVGVYANELSTKHSPKYETDPRIGKIQQAFLKACEKATTVEKVKKAAAVAQQQWESLQAMDEMMNPKKAEEEKVSTAENFRARTARIDEWTERMRDWKSRRRR